MRSVIAFIAAAIALPLVASAAETPTCTAKDFATAVDQSGASLRALTLEAQPKLQERLRRYKEAKKLSDDAYENTALDAIQDSTLDALDKKSSDLLLTVDSLGRVPDGTQPDCAKLEQVKAAAAELNKVIKAKSDYMLRRLDEKIAEAEPQAPVSAPTPKPMAAAPKPNAEKPVRPATSPTKRVTPPSVASKPAPATPAWTADTKPNDSYVAPNLAMREPDRSPALPPLAQDGYTIDEIRDASRGFFGTISTNLASVIEHAFKQMGRPTAYVLGTEGGGAFLAGLRFGQGTLYMRSERDVRKVYWHGPSLGTDFGASGSRTLFLIYRMQGADDLYRNFTGIDGSAYFVGGVGLTLLKGGPVIMAPIRSGVGVRLGANVGYVRFTQRPTWNPF
ncbi:MAG TPA: EipA family protein [Hyphomicrobium sp.]|jgi:hypothetical protein